MSTIEFTNVSVHYDDRLVLNDINLTLTENRIGRNPNLPPQVTHS